MKKVLILAYDFPPYVSVGGLRPKAWLDHLYDYDIEPTVITRQWSNIHGNGLDYIEKSHSPQVVIETTSRGTIIRTPYSPNLSNRLLLKYGEKRFRKIRKILTAYYEIFQYILPVGTKKNIYLEAKKYLQENEIDCIIATGDPFILFQYAQKLSVQNSTPWIADYRDPWSHVFENHGSFFEKKWSQFWEKRIIKNSSAVTTVSDLLKTKISSFTGQKNTFVITNGFDSTAIEKTKEIDSKGGNLKIGFAGSIFKWNPIYNLLNSLNEFIEKNPTKQIELLLLGVNIENQLKQNISKHYPLLNEKIHFTPRLQNTELLQKLATCNVLLLFNHYSILGTKIFDYIGLQRKILLCYTDDEESNQLKRQYFPLQEISSISNQLQADLIENTNSGIAVKDANHLKSILNELTNEFDESGNISCNSVNIEQYSRKIQTKKLAALIKSIC